jgi:hypothetical protein
MALRERIEANPVVSVVSAAGAGFVAGMLVMLGVMQVIISDRGPRDRTVVQNPIPEATRAPLIQLPGARETKNPPPIGKMEMTSSEFVRRYGDLDGRFAEQEAFIKRADGKRARCKVIFTSPASSSREDVSEIAAYFDVPSESSNERPLFGSPVRWAVFPDNFRDRLYSLKRGDLIEISGILRRIGGNQLQVQADDFDIILTPTPTTTPSASPGSSIKKG